MFEVGDTVKWTSQSKSYTREKVGQIVAIVQPRYKPWGLNYHLGDWLNRSDWHKEYSTRWGYGQSRNHVSYVVAVKVGKTDKAKKALYWPRVSGLEKVE